MTTLRQIAKTLCVLTVPTILCLAPGAADAQQFDPSLYEGMQWRLIGPFRGGRVLAVSGVADQPNVYYFGAVGGGVWKTTDGGRIWKPIFDQAPVASIGALAVAASDPNVIYVGTGEADMRSDISFGDGVYKSNDGGGTWLHIGLGDSRHIGRIIIHPHDPKIVWVAALGHAYGPNAERGVFRSADGGATWQRVLFKNEDTGAIDLCLDPSNSRIVYAALWQTRRPPWSTYPPLGGPGGGLYKSTDGGITWHELIGHGLPSGELGRIGIAVGYGENSNRVYALIDAKEGGLFRSDDAGENWRRVGTDPRITERAWYFSGVFVDPHDPDTVYVAEVSLYRSSDGGKTFTALKGAPGGDDYHSLWIDPGNSDRMIVGTDQGATLSVDGGKTWSSWYNQPTAQFYHVAADNQFPYFVYGAQQDSGTAAVASRSDYGEITFRDWHPVGGGESGYIAPDPTDPNTVFAGSALGGLFRYDNRTGQSHNASPWPASNFGAPIAQRKYRFTWTSPLAFSPQDPHVLYLGAQVLLKTTDGGMSWQAISPDLTGTKPTAQASGEPVTLANAKAKGYGVIYTIAPSPVSAGQIWAGTDTGLVWLTRDGGKTWINVTPPGLSDWSKISLIGASRFDAGTAYAAVDRHRLDDYNPYIFRTHDYGKTWTKITAGIAAPAYVHAAREDPGHKGLLLAGTETGVYISFDDGEHWQSLQLNLPTAPIHDLVVHGDDLVVATHGRSFWILDDITPLRQLDSRVAGAQGYLFRPATAIRVRRNVSQDTPLPPETPVGTNPPSGAILDYYLKSAPEGDITLEILDSRGRLVRRFSSADKPQPLEELLRFPDYWLRPPQPPEQSAGMHRFVWDLRYPTPPSIRYHHTIAAIFGQNNPALPEGALALPGKYEVRLTVAGRTYTQPLVVTMDPRVTTSPADLEKQFELAMKIVDALKQDFQAYSQIGSLRSQLKALEHRLADEPSHGPIVQAAEELDGKAAAIAGEWGPISPPTGGLAKINDTLAALATVVESADRGPTAQSYAVFEESLEELKAELTEWDKLRSKDLPALNALMRQNKIPFVSPAPDSPPR